MFWLWCLGKRRLQMTSDADCLDLALTKKKWEKKGRAWFRRGYRSILELIKEIYSPIRASTSPLSVDHRPRRLHEHVPDLLCNTLEDNHRTGMWRLARVWLNRLLYASFFVLCSVSIGDSSASQHTAFCASVAPNPISSRNVNIGRLCKTLVCGKKIAFFFKHSMTFYLRVEYLCNRD